MKILFLTSAHNSLSQRLLLELTERGHDNSPCKPVSVHTWNWTPAQSEAAPAA